MTEEHIVEKKTYYSVFAALMALLITTIGVAYIHLGELNIIVALSIAFIKAALIALYFMHIRYSSRLLWVFAGAGLFWLGIMFALAFADYLTRGLVSPPAGWQ
jgi:cytochrome c oxidase subunit 4